MSKFKNRYVGTENGILDTKKKDELIPESEPIFIIRGSDPKALDTIANYRSQQTSKEKRAAISLVIEAITEFQETD